MGALMHRRAGERRPQRGDILFLTLLTLLIVGLGFLYTVRTVVVDTRLAGNNLARQKDVQVSDIALRRLESAIAASFADQPLEISGTGQAWYRDVDAGTAAPSAAYWAKCLRNSSGKLRCGSIAVAVGATTLPYQALAVVQPTGRGDPHACGMYPLYSARYYDIYIRVAEASGVTAATTQTVYKLCLRN